MRFEILGSWLDKGVVNHRRRGMMIALPAVCVGPLMAGVVHALGHAVAVWLCGGRLEAVQPLWLLGAPHVHFAGDLGAAAMAVVQVSGVGAVLVLSWGVLALVPFGRLSHAGALSLAVVVASLFTQVAAWVVMPLLRWMGFGLRDDALGFMEATGVHPLWVAGVSGLLLAGTGFWFLARTRLVERWEALRRELEE